MEFWVNDCMIFFSKNVYNLQKVWIGVDNRKIVVNILGASVFGEFDGTCYLFEFNLISKANYTMWN